MGGIGNVWGVIFGGIVLGTFNFILVDSVAGWMRALSRVLGMPFLAQIDIVNMKLMLFGLALFIFVVGRQQQMILEAGAEDSPFGYDFSQGYTSLERDNPPEPKPRKPGPIGRWRQERARRRLQREHEQRVAEEARLDELLAKVAEVGMDGLTDEERRFLQRVSAKKRNRTEN